MDTAFFGTSGHFAHQVSLNLAELASGLLGALAVILAGLAWRHARADAPDQTN
jgi:hypothetical protein